MGIWDVFGIRISSFFNFWECLKDFGIGREIVEIGVKKLKDRR